jgi:hypothetical protein
MDNSTKKVKATIHLTQDAQDILFDHGYASERTVGAFISQLIVEHHERMQRAKSDEPPPPPTHAEIVAELRRLVELLDRR